MSEINQTPEELVEELEYEVESANVIPTPIDPTLTHQGESADAYATGQAIAQVLTGLLINNKALVNKALTLYATDILMNNEENALSIPEAIENIANRDASNIIFDAQELTTVKDVIDNINDVLDSELSESEIDDIFEEVFGGGE